MRKFEKVSFEEFKKEFGNNKNLYNSYNIPKRKTIDSAGYDFEAIEDFTIKPKESLKIPLGVKVTMDKGEMIMIVVRSSVGFKYNVRMQNQVGIIERDYYNNDSHEGHLFIKLKNEGNSDFVVKKGQGIAQGIFVNFLTVDNEEKIETVRTGGIGSTD